MKNFTSDPVLSTFYRMLTTTPDLEGKRFVSTIESMYECIDFYLLIIIFLHF